ncbi:hypothetical protein QAD02_004862 [Eretmocerus hayati]|uniref:Uncharacterized protein n=1 Tax=Eretmocerus hayati TaxID=131215 RepID=A0ACC2NQQ9_9HYME|nr:hypothetical protein QAD02_004862 [Eretmocerus hayati]
MPDVAVVGSCMIDLITYSSRLPKPGETLLGLKFEKGFGGKGANQCVTAARLGASTVLVSSLGSDSNGQEYLKKLEEENINTAHIKTQENIHTGVAQITVTSSGENSIIIVQGSNLCLSGENVIEAKKHICSSKVLLCQFEVPLLATLEALRVYQGHGTSIVNGAPAVNNVDPDILRLADIFCVNETEAELMTGMKDLSISTAQQAVDKFFSLGCNTIIITFGAQGAIHASSKNKTAIHTPSETVKAVDTTGAGDAFLGALAYYISNHPGLSLQECIKRSNKIAAQSVTKLGTQTSFPSRKELPSELFS